MMKKITIFFLLLVSTNSFAEIITQTQEVSFGEQGSTTNVSVGELNEILSISAFDTALGILTDVRITVFGSINTKGEITNNSIVAGSATAGLGVKANWQVSSSAASTYVFEGRTFTGEYIASDQTSMLGTGEIFEFDFETGMETAELTGVNIAEFTTGNDIDFNFTAELDTAFTIVGQSGTGANTISYETGSWGSIRVDYIYDTEVPEPSTIVILGLGVMGLFLNRKKRV